MQGPIISTVGDSTVLSAAKGDVTVIDSTGTGYTSLIRSKANNGVYNLFKYQNLFGIDYTTYDTIRQEQNNYSKRLILIDENGDCVHPGKVTAPEFVGSLTGDVTGNISGSATKLKVPITITVGGSSRTFDGSEDIEFDLAEIMGGTTLKVNTIQIGDAILRWDSEQERLVIDMVEK